MAEFDKAALNDKLRERFTLLEKAYDMVADPDLQLQAADIPSARELIRESLNYDLTPEEHAFVANNAPVLSSLCKIWGLLQWVNNNLDIYNREYQTKGYSLDKDYFAGFGRNYLYIRLPLKEAYEASQETLRAIQKSSS